MNLLPPRWRSLLRLKSPTVLPCSGSANHRSLLYLNPTPTTTNNATSLRLRPCLDTNVRSKPSGEGVQQKVRRDCGGPFHRCPVWSAWCSSRMKDPSRYCQQFSKRYQFSHDIVRDGGGPWHLLDLLFMFDEARVLCKIEAIDGGSVKTCYDLSDDRWRDT
jgi:hypothetical protein